MRATLIGTADKGILLTTGRFTEKVIAEATRDGAPPVDLIDGDLMMDRLKELGLGVRSDEVIVERVTIDREWFQSI